MKILNHAKKTWFNIEKRPENKAEISLYNDIGLWGITADDFKNQLESLGEVNSLTVRINSYGGEVFVGFAIYNAIKQHKATEKIMIVDGVAASIASVIALSGTKLKMPKNAYLMIHDPSVMVAGTSKDLTDAAKMLDQLKETIIDVYKEKKLTLSKDKLDEMMSDESWISAKDALKYGFADEIIDYSESDEPETNFAVKRLPENYREICFNKYAGNPVNKGASMHTCPTCGKEHADGAAFCNHCGAAITMQAKEKVTSLAAAHKKEVDEAKAAAERRVINITNHCKALDFDDKTIDEFVKSGKNLDELAETITNKLREKQETKQTPATNIVSITLDGADKFRDHSVKSLSVALNIEKDQAVINDVKKNPGVTDMHGLVRECLIRDGMSPLDVARMSPKNLADTALQRAKNSIGGADLPAILADTMNKSLNITPAEADVTFDQVCSVSETPDFRTKSFTKLSGFGDIDNLPEGASFRHGSFSDKKETGAVSTKGKMITLTRQLIVNNDTQALTEFPRAMIDAVYQRMNRDCYDLLTYNSGVGPVLTEDGVAVFNSAHSNICTAGAVSITSIDNMNQFFGKQKQLKAKAEDPNVYVNRKVKKIVCGTSQYLAAQQVVNSAFDPSGTNSIKFNPFTGAAVNGAIQIISDAYLQSIIELASGMNKAGAWYGFADQNRYPTLTVMYLSGSRTPSLRSEPSGVGEAQGISWEIFFDWGFTFQDFRGIAYNAGA